MKKLICASLICLFAVSYKANAQETTPASSEEFGNTLNIGFGIGYYGYVGHTLPVIHADYEFEAANNFTLAPFVTLYSYRNYYYWGNPNYPYRNYYYRQTVIPIGVKGCYYFDDILHAGPRWDFYLGASLGFAIRKTVWEDGYYGETVINHGTSGLYVDGHLGTEFHMTNSLGLYLDLSTGQSMIGLACHF
jgi:hypothetical protein